MGPTSKGRERSGGRGGKERGRREGVKGAGRGKEGRGKGKGRKREKEGKRKEKEGEGEPPLFVLVYAS